MEIKVVFMILQTSPELKYLIDVLENCLNDIVTVHLHHNNKIDKSSTIKYESDLTISDYNNKKYLLALDPDTLQYKPLQRNESKYESKDKFIIWYENIYDVLEHIIYTTLIKSVEFTDKESVNNENCKKILNYKDIIAEGDYFIQSLKTY